MPAEETPARATAFALSLAASILLSGCVGPLAQGPWQGATFHGADPGPAAEPAWREGDWWAYHVTILGNTTVDMALVVDEARTDGYRLGNNASRGFFGLPFHGNMTRELHPRLGDQTWRMFRFPLQPGDTWKQELYGHTVKTEVSATRITLPDGSTEPGYELEATTYGSLLARYTYSPTAGWMTGFLLRDPGTGDVILEAELKDHGRDFDKGYYVREPLRTVELTYPGTLPGSVDVPVDAPGEQLAATLLVDGDAGAFQAELRTPSGEGVVDARVTGHGIATDQATTSLQEGTYRLHHQGAGAGRVLLQLHVVQRVGPPAATDSGTSGGGSNVLDLPLTIR